jgi:hypothetical protein
MAKAIKTSVVRTGEKPSVTRFWNKTDAMREIMRIVRRWRDANGYTAPKCGRSNCCYALKRYGKETGDIYLSEGWV